MIPEQGFWTVLTTAAADEDVHRVIDWTLEQFGDQEAIVYAETIAAALEALSDGPTAIGVKERSEIAKGLFTLHIARGGRRGWHFFLFRVIDEGRTRTIEVLRLLHDGMDLERHGPVARDL